MKHLKWFSLFLSVSLLCALLCSCISNAPKDPQELFRSAKFVTATDGELLFTLELTETGGIYRFSSPELLQPLTVTFADGVTHASYQGLETDVSDPFCANLLPLCHVFHALRMTDAERGEQGAQSYLRITLDEDTFLLYYDSDSGVATRLEWTGKLGTGGLDILSCTNPETNS